MSWICFCCLSLLLVLFHGAFPPCVLAYSLPLKNNLWAFLKDRIKVFSPREDLHFTFARCLGKYLFGIILKFKVWGFFYYLGNVNLATNPAGSESPPCCVQHQRHFLAVLQEIKEGLGLLLFHLREGNGNPLQCSCLENSRDGGAWWAAVCGVAQSRTRLKRLSSSGSCFTLTLRT